MSERREFLGALLGLFWLRGTKDPPPPPELSSTCIHAVGRDYRRIEAWSAPPQPKLTAKQIRKWTAAIRDGYDR